MTLIVALRALNLINTILKAVSIQSVPVVTTLVGHLLVLSNHTNNHN